MSLVWRIRNKILLSLVFGAVIYVGMTIYADLGQLARALAEFRWIFIPFILACAFASYLIRFLKWHYYIGTLGIHVPRKDSLLIFFSGFIMSITPAKMGEVLKSFLLKQVNGTPISKSAPVVVAERLTDVIGLMVLSLGGITAYAFGEKVLFIVGAFLAAFIILLSTKPLILRVIGLFERGGILSRIARKMHTAYESIFQLLNLKTLVWSTVLSIFAWSVECAGFFLTLRGFGAYYEPMKTAFMYSFPIIAGAVTMLPGGIGITEGSMTGLLQGAAMPKSQAVATTLLFRVCTLWFAVLVGAVVLYIFQRKFGEPPLPEALENGYLKEIDERTLHDGEAAGQSRTR
jgi:uncharacterized protein (TIRG00374 family)